ncbi:hypothetical protein [Streptomyces sp. NPDC005799]|uniref:hypothetical protein n=1 Tax=Streptomyces sp. NPDC005799 TaxID=3154678 RepID=UPI0033D0BC06
MSTIPKATVAASTATSSIPANTSDSQNDASACMNSTLAKTRCTKDTPPNI